jgi:hypothetical protein
LIARHKKILGAFLNTGKTSHAVKKEGVHVIEVANVAHLLPMTVVDTGLFHAVMASGRNPPASQRCRNFLYEASAEAQVLFLYDI